MIARGLSVLCGLTFLVLGVLADQRWFEMHVFWQYITATPGERWFFRISRAALFLVGALFIVFHRAVGAWLIRKPLLARVSRAGQFALAIVAALGVGEILARRKPEVPAPVARWPDLTWDERLGWYPTPDRKSV